MTQSTCDHGVPIDEDCGRCRAQVFELKARERRHQQIGWVITLIVVLITLAVLGSLYLEAHP